METGILPQKPIRETFSWQVLQLFPLECHRLRMRGLYFNALFILTESSPESDKQLFFQSLQPGALCCVESCSCVNGNVSWCWREQGKGRSSESAWCCQRGGWTPDEADTSGGPHQE